MTTTLHRRRPSAELTLTDALAAAAPAFGTTAIGIAATTAWCGFVRFTGAALVAGPGTKDLSLDDIFDLRLFDEHVELRWVHRAGGAGPAVLLAEDDTRFDDVDVCFSQQAEPPSALIEVIQSTLLLWGSKSGPAGEPGWVRLSEARIGSLEAPYDGPVPDLSTHDLVLQLREYVAAAEDGNAYVLTDRLAGITAVRKKTREEKDR